MFMDLLRQELGSARDAGGETRFNCPFCGNTKHKFYVHNTDGLWICFKCSETGNPVSFVMRYYECDYLEAVDILATYDYDVNAERQSQVSWTSYGQGLTEEEKLLLFISNGGQAPEESRRVSFKCPAPPTNCKNLMANFHNPEALPFFQYLMSRKVTLEQIQTHNISYVTYGEVKLADGRSMTLRNHVVFFTFDEKRKPVYWNTRSIEKDPFIKSFNAPSREDEYSKNNTIFNLNNLHHADKLVVYEGVFNALVTPDCGMATFGKKVTEDQVKMILRYSRLDDKPIYLFLDTDAWQEMITTANLIHAHNPAQLVYFVYTGLDDDPNDLGPVRTREFIANAFLANAEGEMKLRMLNL